MPKPDFNAKRFTVILFMLCTGIFTACKNPADNSPEQENTHVEFKNLEQYPVTVYSDSTRQAVFAEVEANGTKIVPAAPNSAGTAFYITFRIDVPDMEDVSIPYNGPPIVTLIEENKTTLIPIPKLESISINQTYLKLINNGDFSLSLRKGFIEEPPLGGRPSIVTPGQSAAYEISPGPTSRYTVMINAMTPVRFTESFTEFEKGRIYTFTYDGTNLALTSTWPIPSPAWPSAPENFLAEVIIGPNDVQVSNVQLSWDALYGDAFIFLLWNDVDRAGNYSIYRRELLGSGNYFKIGEVTYGISNYISFLDGTGLKPRTMYRYIVSAHVDDIEYFQSPVFATTVPSIDFHITDTTAAGISLAWNTVNEASYEIHRSDSEHGTFNRIANLLTDSNYIDLNISPNSTYYYYIGITFNVDISTPYTIQLSDRKISATTGWQ